MKVVPHRLINNSILEIDIYGLIFDVWWDEDCIGTKDLKRTIENYPNASEIHLRFNTEGGDTVEGQAMYNILKDINKKKVGFIDGMCASAGGLLLCACDETYARNNTLFMMHNPYIRTEGDAVKLRKKADLLDLTKETVINTYMSKCNLESEEISKMMEAETWMSASEAYEHGFLTEVKGEIEKEQIENIEKIMNRKMVMMFNNFPKEKILNLISTETKNPIVALSDNNNLEEEKSEEEEINVNSLEELKEKFPTIYNQAKEEGIEEGRNAERERIKAIDNLKGDSAILNRAKFEEIKDAGAVAIELNAKNEEERSKMLAGIQEKENLGNSGTPETEDVIMNKVMDEINNKR